MEKTFAYATFNNQLVIGELNIEGSVKIHYGNSIYGLSVLRDLNEFGKYDSLGVTYKANGKSGIGKLIINRNKPKVLTKDNELINADECVLYKD